MRLVQKTKRIRVAGEGETLTQGRMRFEMSRFGTRVGREQTVAEVICAPRSGSERRRVIEAQLLPSGTGLTRATNNAIDAPNGRAVKSSSRRVREALDHRNDWYPKKLRQPLSDWIAP